MLNCITIVFRFSLHEYKSHLLYSQTILSINCYSQNDNFQSIYIDILNSKIKSERILEIGDSLNKISVNNEQKIFSSLINYVGNIQKSDIGIALQNLLHAESIAKKMNNSQLSIRVNVELINLYLKLKLYEEAISKLHETDDIISKLPVDSFYINAKHANLFLTAKILLEQNKLIQAKNMRLKLLIY